MVVPYHTFVCVIYLYVFIGSFLLTKGFPAFIKWKYIMIKYKNHVESKILRSFDLLPIDSFICVRAIVIFYLYISVHLLVFYTKMIPTSDSVQQT